MEPQRKASFEDTIKLNLLARRKKKRSWSKNIFTIVMCGIFTLVVSGELQFSSPFEIIFQREREKKFSESKNFLRFKNKYLYPYFGALKFP